MTPDYLKFMIHSSRSMGMFDETAKRLKYAPFDDASFRWKLLYENTPVFFALRHMLREGEYRFELVVADPQSPQEVQDVTLITPWTTYEGPPSYIVRGMEVARCALPLYYESGEWGCPQQNFLFDWSREMAWAYLVDRGVTTVEEVCK